MKVLVGAALIAVLSAAPLGAQTADDPGEPGQPVAAQPSAPVAAQPPVPPPPDPGKNAAPVRTHTGWATLVKDTGVDFAAFPRRRSTWTLLGLGAAGALAAYPADDYIESHAVGNEVAERVFSVGKWVGSTYVQIGTGVGLWAVGRYVFAPAANEPQTNKYSEVGFDLMRAQFLSQVVVHAMKYSFQRDRPTGECCAFPSGHSATAFAVASVLERHFGYRASWPALATAGYIAASRLVDNRHFLSDVVMGAGVGTAAGWTVVGTRGRSGVTMLPVPVKGGMMLAFTHAPRESAAPIR